MASKTIHTLSYKIIADTRQLTPGLVLGKKEVNLLKREMNSSLTPIQKMKNRLDDLGKVVQKDSKFQEIYNHKLKEYKTAVANAGKANAKAGKSFSRLRAHIAGAAAAYVSFRGVMSAGRGLVTITERLDKLSKSARAFGVSTEFLTRFQFAASSESGLSEEATATAIQRMQRRISEAAIGKGEAQGALKELGLDAKALAASGGEEAMMALADAMKNVTNESDVLRLSTKLFDTEAARLGLTLKQGTEELLRQFETSDKLGRTLTTIDGLKAEQAAQALKELGLSVSGVAMKITTELLPAIEGIANGLKKVPGFFERAGTGIEAIGRTITNQSGQLFSNPMAEFQTNAVNTIGDRNREARAEVALAKSTARLKAMQEAKANKEIAAKEATKTLAAQKIADQKQTDAWSGFLGNVGVAIFQEASVQRELGIGFQSREREDIPNFKQLTSQTTDPMASIAAGSSEAFRILNRTTTGGGELELAQKRTKNSEKMVTVLESIETMLTPAEPADVL